MHASRLLELSRTHARLVALLVAGALVAPMLAGCDASNGSEDTGSQDAQATAASSADATAAEGSSSDADSTDAAQDAAASDSDQAQATPSFDFSAALDDDGHWKDVTALDYVTLPADYTAIPVPLASVEPSDEDVQSKIDSITSSYATTEQVTDRAVEDGDTVNIDYVGSIDGVEFDGGSTQGNGTTVTIGVTQYIDDFLDQLVGHKPGETFDVNVTFPDDYGKDELNGKDAVFSVTINYIQETTQPEVDDTWVEQNLKDSYGWTTCEEMWLGVAEDLQHTNVANFVQDYVLSNSQASEVPSSITDFQGDQLVYQYEYYASMYGMDLASFLKMSAGVETTDELLANNQSSLEEAAKAYLVFQAIAEDAGISVSDEELSSYLQSVTGSTDMDSLEGQYGRGYLMLQALVQKVGEYLVSSADIEEGDAAETGSSDTADAADGSTSEDKTQSGASNSSDAAATSK